MIAQKEHIETITGWEHVEELADEHRKLTEELMLVKKNWAYFRDQNDERARKRVSKAINTALRGHIEREDEVCGMYLKDTIKNKYGLFFYDPSCIADYTPSWIL